ncbi:hypothetical protein P4W15_07975 [Morganella morganii]|nr:hypothetical protein [Morganella morganii]
MKTVWWLMIFVSACRGAVSALDVSAAAVIRLRKVQHLYRVISATLYAPP